MATATIRATLDDLYAVEGKAELIDGRIVHPMASGSLPSSVAFEIAVSLRQHAKVTRSGLAYADGVGFAVPELTSGRESFSPDAAFYCGALPINPMRFIDGPPTFAVEVRSENDYGSGAEAEMAAKRADYFEAGTQVVWDVDPLAGTIAVYRVNESTPSIFHRGATADAEPAVPGWRFPVDDMWSELTRNEPRP